MILLNEICDSYRLFSKYCYDSEIQESVKLSEASSHIRWLNGL
jgi:hypothetical protein